MNDNKSTNYTSFKDVDWKTVPYFVNADNQHIFCRYWSKDQEATDIKGIVMVCHGAGEHCAFYDGIAKSLVERGLYVAAHDHVGHGLSEGDRVHLADFYIYVRDVLQHVSLLQDKYPGKPVFLLGHSMGGLIVCSTAMEKPDLFQGVVMIGPALVPNPDTATPFKVRLAKFAGWLMPQLQVGKIEEKWICQDQAIQDAYAADPMVWHGGLKARWAVCMLQEMASVQKRFSEIKWPYLIVHGDADKLCELKGSQMLHQEAASTDKTLEIIKGGYHQVHNEPNGVGEQCIALMTDWLASRC